MLMKKVDPLPNDTFFFLVNAIFTMNVSNAGQLYGVGIVKSSSPFLS